MLVSSLRRAALASATALLAVSTALAQGSDDNATQSTFVSDNGKLAFGLIAPRNHGTDMYFSLRVHKSRSWGAVGMGHESMEGSLMLVIYQNADGSNVTLSPRLAEGDYEPAYLDEIEWEVLEDTGIFGDYMHLTALCTEHCRSWPHGSLDVTGASEPANYLLGPEGSLRSDEPDADLSMYREYGSFRIDMKRTNDYAEAPVLDDNSENDGVEVLSEGDHGREWKAVFHAVFMIIALIVLLPTGMLAIQLGQRVRLHIINQSALMVFSIVGVGLGIALSFNYQRSRGFDSTHQILGLVTFSFLFVQFALGFFHHLKFKKTQKPTKLNQPHRYFGYAIWVMGMTNAFCGFAFANHRFYQSALLGLIISISVLMLVAVFGRKWWKRRSNPSPNGPFYGGYPSQPGGNAPPQPGYGFAPQYPPNSGGGGGVPPPYSDQPGPRASPSGPDIGLSTMASSPGYVGKESKGADKDDLGPAQAPREML